MQFIITRYIQVCVYIYRSKLRQNCTRSHNITLIFLMHSCFGHISQSEIDKLFDIFDLLYFTKQDQGYWNELRRGREMHPSIGIYQLDLFGLEFLSEICSLQAWRCKY